MKYNKYTIKTITEAEDIISSTLMDLGIEGVEIEDKLPLSDQDKAAMFVDILPQTEADDGVAYLSFYLDADEDNGPVLESVKAELEDLKSFMDVGDCSIIATQLQDTDYINNWKQYFHQFYITGDHAKGEEDILIVPSWEEVKAEDEGKMIVHIDPGTAFGTGMHETTQLCIKELRKYVGKDTALLDVGTGSGILSIMAYKFGAASAVGTDLDPCAIEAVQDNMEKNGLDEAGFKLIIGNIIDSREIQDEVGYGCYDIVAANILAEVLVPLTPVIVSCLKPGGIYITSGIIEDKEQTVVDAVRAAGLEVIEVNHQGEWVSVTATRK
ncbi:MAG: 50S ribosomal protein L11 methyltransferase [Lachnospiraceae bacterium]|nr:50S ribosomal protein L11 methyltransferase [Lachnospiraceae bacterium]